MQEADLIIIGAGPAGMRAAAIAASGGLQVLLLDEQPQPGGQIYRNVGQNGPGRAWLGPEYVQGAQFLMALGHPNIKTEYGASVWRVDDCGRVAWSRGTTSHASTAPHVILAGGAQERPMPFPGWTLPGVMPAGAAQIAMKTAGLLPRDAILAGSGPLLYLIAAQLIAAGAPPKALVETQTKTMMLRALPFVPKALFSWPVLRKGLRLLRKIKAAGVPRIVGASGFRAETTPKGEVAFSFTQKGRSTSLTTPILLTHQGVIPATHISRSAGIDHQWNPAQMAFHPTADKWGQTSVPALHIAGDGAGIGGAEAAAASGELTALNILHLAGQITQDTRDQRATSARAKQFRARALRPFLDTAYAPLPEFLSPLDETTVCRCEDITAGDIRSTIAEGAAGPRQIKTALRVGMGACQGRQCDPTLRGILTQATGQNSAAPRARSPIKPITLGQLAAHKIDT